MKRIIYIFIFFILLCGSCEEDVFDQEPLNKVTDTELWQDQKTIRAYLTDIYATLDHNAFDIGGSYTWTDIGTTNKGNRQAMTTGAMSNTNDPNDYWDYETVRELNVFLEEIEDSPIAESVKNQMKGEAKALRAWVYFKMQKRYGGVPLVDVVIDPYSEIDEQYTQRSTEEEIADFIDSELDSAIGLLPEDVNPKGRLNKWSAYALKARANLWSASIAKYGDVQSDGLVGIPSGRADEFYTKASEAANAVIQSNNYSLYNEHADETTNYRKLFIDQENNEAIFKKIYDGVELTHQWNLYNLPQSFAGGRGSWENPLLEYILGFENIDGSEDQPDFGPDNLYEDAYAPFENKDPRLKATVFFNGDMWAGNVVDSYEGIDTSSTPDPDAILDTYGNEYNGMPVAGEDSRVMPKDDKSTRSGFMLKKYCVEGAFVTEQSNDYMVFRLAEMYLTKAEAEFELGNTEAASTALNATRERAGISLVDGNTITLDHVRTERRSELAFEHHRWWDLRRWRIARDVLNAHTMQGLRIIYHYETGDFYFLPIDAEPFARIFRPQHYYNPITDSRLDANPDLVENPMY